MKTFELNSLKVKSAFAGLLGFLIVSTGHAAPLTISNTPLFLTARADPNVLINMSVETPMGGAAYTDNVGIPTSACTGRVTYGGGAVGTCYFTTVDYLGYFDPKKCYSYDTTNNYFYPVKATNSDHSCSPASTYWSGNLLNWATMTAIDEFIWTMTGGNRVTDTNSLTVIKRARKQNNDSWFPHKVIRSAYNVAPSTVTPYTDNDIFISNTDWGFNTGTSLGGTEKFANRLVQVKVCDNSVGRENNCVAYTSGTTYYKPEGLIQQNAAGKRFGLVSYTLDNTQARDGGVLRSNMKYVGPNSKTYPTGAVTANSVKEYDGTTGFLISNPDTATGSLNSGVINYINQFSTPGYKSYDPISELFYEGLRYFKRLAPTPEYSSGITRASTDANMGGFWFYNTSAEWQDPIQYSCQKNFIIAINDANPWLDKKLPGTSFTTATITGAGATNYTLTAGDYGEPSNPDTDINVTTWTNSVGALETVGGITLNSAGPWTTTGTWTSGTASGSNDSVGGGAGTFDNSCTNKNGSAMSLGEVMGTCPYAPKENSYYIAGLAFYANTTDIRSGLTGKQTVSTFMIDTQEYSTNPLDGPRNMLWLAGKYGGFIDTDSSGTPNLASEWDADGDGIPDNYVLATQPQKMIDGLNAAFVDIENRLASAASLAVNSATLNAGTRAYQTRFNSADWTGDLVALSLNVTAGTITGEVWHAKDQLPAPISRIIITRNGTFDLNMLGTSANIDTTATTRGVAFVWPSIPASPTADEINLSQVAYLKTGGASDTLGSQRLDYLRGVTTQECSTCNPKFRNRGGNELGDFINSAPAYVGAPAYLPALETTPHSTFRNTSPVVNRTPVIYVGGNDGMLHGFNASTGAEVLAYVPYSVYANLYLLTNPSYSHRYFVDSSPTFGDVYGNFGTRCSTSNCWRTVLISALGGGGKGIFALDITDPSVFSQANASKISLWEFTDATDADLGYTYSQPQIAKMQDGTWRAIFGNGYNSTSEKAVLYLVNIANPKDVQKITLDNTGANGNGLSTPQVVDTDGDYVADYIYVGDLRGNMWKVDVTSTNSSSWSTFFGTVGSPNPLFAAGTTKPITSKPEVTKQTVAGLGGLMIYFGTGRYLVDSDVADTNTQTFYGIWDKNTSAFQSQAPVTSVRLLPQTLSQTTTAIGSTPVLTVTDDPINNWDNAGAACGTGATARCMGWYVNLPRPAERVIANPGVIPGSAEPTIAFVTFIPATVPCSYGGNSWLVELDPVNGGRLNSNAIDVNGDGVFDSKDMVSSTVSASGAQVGTGGGASSPTFLHGGGSGGTPTVFKEFSTTSATVVTMRNTGKKLGRTSWRQMK